MLYVSVSVVTFVFLSLFPGRSFPLVLPLFIVITAAAPLESSAFFSSGAINEEGLTPSTPHPPLLSPRIPSSGASSPASLSSLSHLLFHLSLRPSLSASSLSSVKHQVFLLDFFFCPYFKMCPPFCSCVSPLYHR